MEFFVLPSSKSSNSKTLTQPLCNVNDTNSESAFQITNSCAQRICNRLSSKTSASRACCRMFSVICVSTPIDRTDSYPASRAFLMLPITSDLPVSISMAIISPGRRASRSMAWVDETLFSSLTSYPLVSKCFLTTPRQYSWRIPALAFRTLTSTPSVLAVSRPAFVRERITVMPLGVGMAFSVMRSRAMRLRFMAVPLRRLILSF